MNAYQNDATNVTASNARNQESRKEPVRGLSTKYGMTALAVRSAARRGFRPSRSNDLRTSSNPGIK